MRDASPLQIERDIARCRVIFSIAAPFAVYLDRTEPTLILRLTGGVFLLDPYALAVLVLHFLYSLAVAVVVSRPSVGLQRVAIVSMTADVLFGAANGIACLTIAVHAFLPTTGRPRPFHWPAVRPRSPDGDRVDA